VSKTLRRRARDSTTLFVVTGAMVVCQIVVIANPSVRAIREREPVAAPVAA
jgi:hypothetical protein